MILRNNENEDVLLVEHSHILLKKGDNELELSPRRLNIALEEIKARELKIQVVEEEKGEVSGRELEGENNASKAKNKGKEKQ